MNKNDLFKDDKSIYRILSIKEKILIIDCIKRTMPYFVNEITGTKITEQDLQIETGRILIDIEELSPNSRKKAYGCYTVISSIIAVVDNVPLRNSMIELASQQYGLSKQTVRSYLCLYLAYQEISVFALPPPKERELTADEKIMRWALNRFFYTRNKNSLKTAFELMLKAKYCDDYGKIRPGHPTFNQFRYFYTLDVFERIIVKCIVYYNTQRIIENYPFTEEMIGVKPYASEIWNYKVQSERKNLIPIDKDTLVLTLFPRTTGRFTRYGLKINKLRYHREGYKEQYLQGGEVEVSYNPDNVSTVWIKDIDGSYIAFGLIDSRFADKTLNEVNSMLSKQKTVIKNEQEANYQAKIDLITYIESVSSGKKSNKTKIKGRPREEKNIRIWGKK